MRLDDLVEHLVQFGLDEREAQLYYHLARLGGARASRAAEAAGLGRTEAYRLLDSLVNRGLVDRTAQRPQRFLPRPIDEALDSLVSREQARVRELQAIQEPIVQAWPRGAGPDYEPVRYAVVEGRNQVRGALNRLVAEAREEVVLVALSRGLARLDQLGVLDALAQRRQDGVRIRVLTEVVERNRETVERWAETAQVRHLPHEAYHQALIVDNREIGLFLAVDPRVSVGQAGRETVLTLNARDFVLSQKALADGLWARGVPLDERLSALDAGVQAERASIVRGRWARVDHLKDLLHRADRTVWLWLAQEENDRLQTTGLAAALQELAKAGVRVRVLSPTEAPIEGVEHREAADGPVPGSRLVASVDGQEALWVLSRSGLGDGLTEPGEWSMALSVRETVEALQERFEALWARADQSG